MNRGKVTQICAVRGREQICAPLNQVLIQDSGANTEAYASCSCGLRFDLPASARQRLARAAEAHAATSAALVGPSHPEASALNTLIKQTLWPRNQTSPTAKQGIVPVGIPVLHRPTREVAVISPGLARFCQYMSAAMRRAEGIGLAANQVGVPVRVLTHNLGRIVPEAVINPKILQVRSRWNYSEGCLSLKVEGTRGEVVRPKVVTLVATLADGRILALIADEVLARVLQHEVDHLDGIEYVQRLVSPERERVYAIMEDHGVDLTDLPLLPYGTSAGLRVESG